MKPASKRPTKRKNIAASFFEDLRDEPVELPSFISDRIESSNPVPSAKSSKPENPVQETVSKALDSELNSRSLDQSIFSRDSLENIDSVSRAMSFEPPISREYPPPELESLQRVSREDLEKKPVELTRIVGLQKRVLGVVFSILQRTGSRVTPPVAIGLISEQSNASIANTQNAIKELIKKGAMYRRAFQRGRGGWTIYEIQNVIYVQLDQEKTRDSLENLQRVSSIQMGAKSRETLSSSSRDLYLNNSTTTQNVDNSESDASAFKNLDFSIVTEFGITSSTIARCRELYPLVPNDQLAALVERFGQFMKTSDGKRVQNARGFFISLAEQLSKGVTPLDHIETSSEALMREFVDRAKEAKARRELLEKEAFEFAFEEWIESLDSKTRNELVPVSSVIESGSKIQTMKLKEHFRLSIWPTRFAVSKEPRGAEA